MRCDDSCAYEGTYDSSDDLCVLAAAIITEVIATIALAESESLTKLVPSIIAVVCFAAAFWP